MSDLIRAALVFAAAVSKVTTTEVDDRLVAFAQSNEEFILAIAEWLAEVIDSESEPERMPLFGAGVVRAAEKEGLSAKELMTLATLLFQFIKVLRKKG